MKTFVIIKPDAVRRGLIGDIIKRFEQKSLTILRIELHLKSQQWCALHYSNVDLPSEVYHNLAESMVHEPLIGIVLQGEKVVTILRRMIGATDSTQARPGTIRGDFGTLPIHENLIHAADSEDLAKQEAKYFFDPRTDCRLG